MLPSEHLVDTADSNRNLHWERRLSLIVEALDTLGIRYLSQDVRDKVEQVAKDANRAYLSLMSCKKAETGNSDAPE